MTSKVANTVSKPIASKKGQVSFIRLGLAKYLACRELSLLVREDENMCPVPVHPEVILVESPDKRLEGHADAKLTKSDSHDTGVSITRTNKRQNTGLSLTDNESDSDSESESGSYKSLPLCLEESQESSRHSSGTHQKEESMTLSTEESRVIQRSRLGSIELLVEGRFESKSAEDIQMARARNLENKALELEEKYTQVLKRICGVIPMSDSTYAYALTLFKTVVLRIDASMSCSEPQRMSPRDQGLVAKINTNPTFFRDTEKLFKVCLYEGYKVIEDEYSLYLEDFSKVARIDKQELEELELFVVSDIMDFRLVTLYAFGEKIAEEVRMLTMITTDE